MIITKAQLKTYVQFSDNIPDRLIDFHIKTVQETIVEPLLDSVMLTNINAIIAGSLLFPQLNALYTNYILAWVANNVAYSFYASHGINATQFGMVVISEDTSQPIAPQDRANLLAHTKNTAQTYWLRFRKKLTDEDFTFDSIVYDDIERSKRGINIGIGRVGRKLKRESAYWQNLKDFPC
jgi:hypothetical protein